MFWQHLLSSEEADAVRTPASHPLSSVPFVFLMV